KLDEERCGYLNSLVELIRNSCDKRTLALLICTMIAEADRLNTGERLPSDVPKYRYICDIIRQIRSDPFAEYSNSRLASDSFVSTSKLNRDFKRYTHTTLHEFVIRTRMFHAADILKVSSVADAAEKCGFEDVSHFIRTFRKYYGTTPLKYVKNSESPDADESEFH
nr:helix-turn-helix transcriptional regulator [Clostridia bacterium]